jgi:serine protease Do
MRTLLISAMCLGMGLTGPAFGQAKDKLIVAASPGSYLGVGLRDIDADRAKALGLREEAGVEITMVERDSPAEKAGLKAGDVVTEYNGQRVEGYEQFRRLVHETPAGRDVKLTVVRNGASQTVTAKIGTSSASAFGPGINLPNPPMTLRMPDVPTVHMSTRSSVLGVEGEGLSGQLADFFGVKEGVLVRAVTSGSAADKAGIKAGDVITKIGDTNVSTPSGVSSQLRTQAGKTVPVVLVRDKREMTVNVTLDPDNRGRNEFQRGGFGIFGDDFFRGLYGGGDWL